MINLSRFHRCFVWSCDHWVTPRVGFTTGFLWFYSGSVNRRFVICWFRRTAVFLIHWDSTWGFFPSCIGPSPSYQSPRPNLPILLLSSLSSPMVATRVQLLNPQQGYVIRLRAASFFHETLPFIGTRFALIG